MPITQILSLQERYQDRSKIKVDDVTVYLDDAPDRRQDASRILIGAKMNENQVLTYLTDIDNSAPLVALSWIMNYLGDETYRFFYFNLPIYSGAATYVNEISASGIITQYADIVYHPTSGKHYKAIHTSFSAIEPSVTSGWETYWVEYNINDLPSYKDSNKLTVLIYDTLVSYAYQACLVQQTDRMTDKELCAVCVDTQAFLVVMKAQFLLDAAESSIWQQKASRASMILKEAAKKYCPC